MARRIILALLALGGLAAPAGAQALGTPAVSANAALCREIDVVVSALTVDANYVGSLGARELIELRQARERLGCPAYAERRLEGNVSGDLSAGLGPTVRPAPAPGLIALPPGVGTDEFVPEERVTMTSGSPVNPQRASELLRLQQERTQRIEAAMPIFDGVSDLWENRLRFGPTEPVVKAELVQTDRQVRGYFWITLGDRPGGYATRKLPIVQATVAGARGAEELRIELAGGVRGRLVLMDKGGRLVGDLNGVKVTLFGKRARDARRALDAQFPRPQ